MNKRLQSGSHLILIIIIIVGILVALGVAFFVAVHNKDKETDNAGKSASEVVVDLNQPDLKLKSIGIELGEYNAATGRAGDFLFTKNNISQYGNLILMNYGEVEQANSAEAGGTLSPQSSLIVPIGTKIRSLVDGEVVKVVELYSGDYSIHVASSPESQWIYETEHIINPTVKVGDKVKAGQVIAEPSDYNTRHHPGFALYEIGILHAGNPPEHVCPYNYLDDSIKEQTFAQLRAFYKAWESYMGNENMYDEAKMIVPGCYTLDAISDNNRGALE